MLFKRLALILMLAAGWLVHPAPAAVEAQASATLLILPAESEMFLNNSKTINLVVLGGVDVNAFDVTIRYDPQVLTLESWKYGDYLSSLARVYLRDDPGEFRLAATQLARPGVNGDGILLTFTFKGMGEGISAIDIAAATFSTPGGVSSHPMLEDGLVTVIGPTKTPTTTPSPTVTKTPTVTVTPSQTASITPSATGSLTPTASATATQTRPANFPDESTPTGTASSTPTTTRTPPATRASGASLATEEPPAGTETAQPAQEAVQAADFPAAESTGGGDESMVFGFIPIKALDWIVGGALILLVLAFALLLVLLTRRSPARKH